MTWCAMRTSEWASESELKRERRVKNGTRVYNGVVIMWYEHGGCKYAHHYIQRQQVVYCFCWCWCRCRHYCRCCCCCCVSFFILFFVSFRFFFLRFFSADDTKFAYARIFNDLRSIQFFPTLIFFHRMMRRCVCNSVYHSTFAPATKGTSEIYREKKTQTKQGIKSIAFFVVISRSVFRVSLALEHDVRTNAGKASILNFSIAFHNKLKILTTMLASLLGSALLCARFTTST